MSDRKNRDKGIKKANKKYNRMCDCWYCMDGKAKKRQLVEKEKRLFSRVLWELSQPNKYSV